MLCNVCKKRIETEELLVYQHNHERIVYCSDNCRETIEKHSCKKWCRILKKCYKCKHIFFYRSVIRIGDLYYCEPCRSSMRKVARTEKQRGPRKRNMSKNILSYF